MVEPDDAIDAINAVFGKHPGSRALHAKGAFYAGEFAATPAMAALSTAGHLQGDPVPIRVRWSNGGGNPAAPDGASDVRGMAVSFRLPGGIATDLLGQTAPRFPVRTPEAFLDLVKAGAAPYRLPLFLARNPSAIPALIANAKAKAILSPTSYAVVTYYPVHAYAWFGPDGDTTWVRYRMVPEPGPAPAGSFTGPDRLQDEILARLSAGPVRFTLEIQRAGRDDDPHDPMSVWPGAWEEAGTLSVTGPDPDRETNGEIVVFDPTRIVPGIGLSDDPILHYRSKAYTSSVDRRVG